MEPVEGFKFLGPLSIGLTCLVAIFILHTWEKDRGRSLSHHAGAQKASYTLFALTLTAAGAMFYLFMWKWFGPTLQLPGIFYGVLMFAAINQLVAAWVPDTTGWISVVHKITAYTLAAVMPIVGVFAFSSGELTDAAQLICGISLAVMIVLFVIAFTVKKAWGYYLYYQTSYIASFYLLVLASAYIR